MSITGRHSWGRVSSLSPLQVTRAGAESGVDVWATAGMPLAVGDRVLLLDMDGALIVLQPLVPADTYMPPPSGFVGDLPYPDPGSEQDAVPLWTTSRDDVSGYEPFVDGGGPKGVADWCMFIGVDDATPLTPIYVYPCAAGTSAVPLGTPIAATAAMHVLLYEPTHRTGSCQMLLRWLDAGGTLITESAGGVVDCTPGVEQWAGGTQWGEPVGDWLPWQTAVPTVTATAPAGAAFVQPVAVLTPTAGEEGRTGHDWCVARATLVAAS